MDVDRRELLELGLPAIPALLGGWPARAAAQQRALVTADEEAHVVVVSLASGRLLQRLRTTRDPRSIERAGAGRAVVGHAGAGAISLLEGSPLRVRRVLRGFGEPRHTAVRPGGRIAYVSDSGTGEVAVVDLVALGSSASRIVVLDARRALRPHVARIVTPPFLAHDVGFSPSGRRVWVTAGRVRRIAVFSAFSGDPLRTLAADEAPQHVSFGIDVAYVASGDSGTVRVHRLSDGRVRRTSHVPSGSYNVQRSGSFVVTPSLGTGALSVLDRRGIVRQRARVASAAHDACVV